MKKCFAVIFCLMISFALYFSFTGEVYADEPRSVCRVITNTAEVYSSAESNGTLLFTAKHKAIFTLENETIHTDVLTNTNFLKLYLSDYDNAYIRADNVVINPPLAISTYVTGNASFKKGVSTVSLYEKSESGYTVVSEIAVNRDTPVRLIDGWKKKNEYHRVQLLVGDENQVVWIKTENIKPKGLQYATLITVLSSLLFSIALSVLIGYIVKTRKRKKINSSSK